MSALDWTIRPGEAADLASVLALWRQAESLPTATDSEPSLSRLLVRDPGALLLAVGGDQLVGSLIVGWDGWRGNFYRLAVDPRRRREGIATALVRSGERRLADLGAARLTAIVAAEEVPATAFWASLGYERQADRARFVRIPAEQS